jgi:hypothetical protein
VKKSVEFMHRLNLEIRLKSTPAADPLIVQAHEQSKVELGLCLAEMSKDRNSPAGVSRRTPAVVTQSMAMR